MHKTLANATNTNDTQKDTEGKKIAPTWHVDLSDKIPCHLMRVHVKRSSYRHVLTKPKNPQSREPY